MVLQRTIENLKDRPKHERRAVALLCALGVVVVLLIGWMFFFFRTVHRSVTDVQSQGQTAAVSAENATIGQ